MAVPSDLSGLRIWIRADDIVGLSDGDPIGSITETSGNSFVFSQATGTKKPLYKTNIVNGHAAIRFDGIDDVLSGGAWTTVINSTAAIYTFMAVVRVASSAAGAAATYDDAALVGDSSGNITVSSTRDVSGALTLRAYNWDGNEDFAALTGLTYSSWYQVAQDHDNVTLRIENDNGTFSSVASGVTSAPGVNVLIGSNYTGAKFIAADVPEIIAYNRVLTDTERGQMHAYFTARYVTSTDNTTKPALPGMYHPELVPSMWF